MRLKKELIVFPALFLASIWLINTFWPHSRIEKQTLEGNKTMNKKVIRTENVWKKHLTPEQFHVMRNAGTEKPFSGAYNDHYLKGIYHCAACGTPLFSSDTKYDHGTGWPSFTDPVDDGNIAYHDDFSLCTKRIEVRCAMCDSHLGHVFDDGPSPSSQHFCINSVALDFRPALTEKKAKDRLPAEKFQVATFAAGCFWGVEDKFSKIKGVIRTAVGYTGGNVKNPTYQQVCRGNTGHAEAVHILYDPAILSYTELLDTFFRFHDPTQLDRQGPDVGSQYRSAIFYHSDEQKREAENMIRRLGSAGRFHAPIATQVKPAIEFYEAEEYHQKFYEKLSKRKG
ncbi:MAG: bifunctional methionine sulfoxide reductase B/A protein [Candidatus Aminicenantes bacterium]|nr:MAG: bifunctional methionine sulfoxide reductase B/A protein [Candidatus Aminicenantes bacterium]